MEFTRMNVEQMRRKAIQNTKEKEQQANNAEVQLENLSRHSYGNDYDIKAILKSKQFKETKEYFDIGKVESEYENMMTHNKLIGKKEKYKDYLISLGHKTNDAHSLRQWSKIIDEIVGDIKLAYNIKN